jgi:hypothetical protein
MDEGQVDEIINGDDVCEINEENRAISDWITRII